MKKWLSVFLILPGIFFVSSEGRAFTFPDGIVSYWKFDEGSGITASDSAGGNLGQLGGGDSSRPSWVSGLVGNALEFDGIDDFVKVPDHFSLDLTDAITVEAWVRFDVNFYPVGAATILTKNWDGTNAPYHLTFQDNTWFGSGLFFGVTANSIWHYILTSERPQIDQWYHLAGTFDGTVLKCFLNGVEIGSTPWIGSIVPNNFPLSIGAETDWHWLGRFSAPLDGTIDEVAIYNRALSAAEISKHYEDGLNWGVGYFQETIAIIDIKPGAYPNTYKFNGGTIAVVTFGRPGFNVRNIDQNSVLLSGLPTGRTKNKLQASFLDFDGDGYEDLQTKHPFAKGYFPRGDTFVHLKGTLIDGSLFEGVDSLRIQ